MKYTIEKSGKGWPFHVVLDQETINKIMVNGNKRAVAFVADTEYRYHCGILLKKTIGHYIFVNSEITKKLNLKEGSTIDLTLVIDESKYQFEMPEEMTEVLAQDQVADEIFHGLKPGNQRSLIYLISQVKTSDKKIERALKIADRLKMGITAPLQILK
jgi:hypothetical protein